MRFQFYSISNDLNRLVIGNIGNLVHQSFHIFNLHREFFQLLLLCCQLLLLLEKNIVLFFQICTTTIFRFFFQL